VINDSVTDILVRGSFPIVTTFFSAALKGSSDATSAVWSASRVRSRSIKHSKAIDTSVMNDSFTDMLAQVLSRRHDVFLQR